MNLIITLILSLLIAMPCWAENIQLARMSAAMAGASGGAAAAVGYCTSATACNTPPGVCSSRCEDFEGAGACGDGVHSNCRVAYANYSLDAQDTINFNAVANGTYPCATTINTGVLEVTSTAVASTTSVWSAFAGDITQGVLQLYVNRVAGALVTEGHQISFLVVRDSSGDTSFWLDFYRNATVVVVRLRFYNESAANQSIFSTVTNSTGTWYRINAKWDTAAGTISLSVNGEADVTATTLAKTTPRNPRSARWIINSADFDVYTIQVDNFAVGTGTTYPSACAN